MLSYKDAKNKGIRECIEKMGRAFLESNSDSTCVGYGDADDYAFCYIGVSDEKGQMKRGRSQKIVLTSEERKKFSYIVSCNVWYDDGRVEFKECVLP